MNVLKLLLYPFAVLYDLVTRIRNYLYDKGHKRVVIFKTNVIAVGNLNVGGSGKTPMIEYLITLLKDRYNVVTLSRGFRRETKGFRITNDSDTARSVGDEPYQLYRKFGQEVKVAVGEKRASAIPSILSEFQNTDVILLDDAFQHRSVKPGLNILVTEYSNPFYSDMVIPSGRLRESRHGASRADVIVVTKCRKNLSSEEQKSIESKVKEYAGEDKPVFFSEIEYRSPVSFGSQTSWSDQIVLVSGVAKAKSILEFCSANHNVVRHFDFPDHHHYTVEDLDKVEAFCKSLNGPFSILTTEKDMVKLIHDSFGTYLQRMPWFYIPIRQAFSEGGMKFDKIVLDAVTSASRD